MTIVTFEIIYLQAAVMDPVQRPVGRSPLQKRHSRALPYYFYVIGVLAALGASVLLVLLEVQGNSTPTSGLVKELFVLTNQFHWH